MVESVAKLNNAKMSAQKVRLVADLIRKLPVSKALEILTLSSKKAAKLILKTLESAIANAEHNFGADIESLKIKHIFVDGGMLYKRWHARAKGRGCRIIKHSCHITVVISNNQ